MSLGAVLVAAALVYLVVAYALGGPLVLARHVMAVFGRRRLRYRAVQDEALASSRFTIPVSVLLPTDGEPDAAAAVAHLLTLSYPELELIVINDGSLPALAELRERFDLRACEVFYRRLLATRPVRAIYRSASDPRVLVLDCETATRGEALNCGVNFARYRYVCCADHRARYRRDAVLEAMHAAVEDPARVVGVTTVLAPTPGRERAAVDRPGTWQVLRRLSAVRALLALSGRRRLGLSPDALAGLSIWRRDTLIEVGGFSADPDVEQTELTFRIHRHELDARRAYAILQMSEPVGTPAGSGELIALLGRQQASREAIARVLWQHRLLLLNPRYGLLGLVDLPRYVFSTLVVPWLELLCLAALPLGWVLGVLSAWHLVLIAATLGLGNAVLITTALLAAPAAAWVDHQLARALLLAPVQLFVYRPVELWWRLTALIRLARPAALPGR